LASLAAQTWPALEILIADDASTDGTRAHLERFAAGRSDTRLILRDRNLGWLANTNALMSEARGEWMFFAFHDDVVLPTYVEALATALQDDPEAVLAFSDVELTETGGASRIVTFEALEGLDRPLRRGLVMSREPPGWWVPNRGLFRADAYRRIGGIRRPRGGEIRADWLWLFEMALLGRFRRVPGVLCRKFYRPTSLSKTWTTSAERVAATRRAALDAVAESALAPGGKASLAALISARLVGRYGARKLRDTLMPATRRI
jgi:glycosyltransferase involved in cell wall biosynthesis